MSNITFGEGSYRGTLTKVKLGEAKNGTPQVVFSFLPTGKVVGGRVEQCPQFERSVFRYITEAAVEYLIEDLKRLGYCHDTFDQLDESHPQAFPFAGKEVMVRCAHETHEGVTREKWSFSGGGGLDVKPMERSTVSKLNAMFGAKLKPLGNGGAAKPAAQAAKQPVTETL